MSSEKPLDYSTDKEGKAMERITISSLLVLPAVLVWALFFPTLIPFRAQCMAQDCPQSEFLGSLGQILESPDVFIGCEIRVEGTLETEDQTSYSIRTEQGHSLAVRPWAPLEADHFQYQSETPGAIKSMSYFTGRKLSLKGRLVQERSGGVVLEVSSVGELDERTE